MPVIMGKINPPKKSKSHMKIVQETKLLMKGIGSAQRVARKATRHDIASA